MLVTLYIIGILLGLFRDKSKIVRAYQFIVVWITSVFNTLNADMGTYRVIYQGYYGDTYEIGFVFWRHLFSDRGVSFETFWLVSMTLVVLAIFYTTRKLFNEIHNGAMSLIMIFPLLNMVITLRNSLANAIVLLAFVWYLKCDTSKLKNKILYGIFILVATSFHYATVFFFVMLVIKEELPSNKSLTRAFIIVFLATIGLNTPIFTRLLNTVFHTDKVLDWFSSSHRIGLGIILVWGLQIIEFYIATYSNRCHRDQTELNDELSLSIERKIYSLNVFSMFLMGLYTYNMEFFTRIYSVVMMINVVNNFHLVRKYGRNKYAVYGLWMHVAFILFVFITLYYGENFKKISTIFENNLLFNRYP